MRRKNRVYSIKKNGVKFLLTKELGRLAKWLRILGYDAAYFSQQNHSSLIISALRDDRIILTRNQHLPVRGGVQIILLQAEEIKAQLKETLGKLKINPNPEMIFSRCILCNTQLKGEDKNKVKGRIPEDVFNAQENFVSCPSCNRIYWQGTHWGNVKKTLEEVGL